MLVNAAGASPFLLIGDHAGSAIPRALGDMGLSPADRSRHIALDIGVLGMGLALAGMLDAPFVHQPYSRLVIDCNRDPESVDAMPPTSDGTVIAGNAALTQADREARVSEIHAPYHAAIAALLDAREAVGRQTILLSLHSFTPIMAGIARPWDVGILHGGGQADFAVALIRALGDQPGIVVGDNVPYAMDGTDHTVPRHAFPRGLRYAEIEARQDRIADPSGQSAWAERIARACQAVTPQG